MGQIVAGIVLYNPELERLRENVDAVESQVDKVIFFNNGSNNYTQVKKIFEDTRHIFIGSDSNLGIAYALNELAKEAKKLGASWLLTLDQDSVVQPELIYNYRKYFSLPNIGQLSCRLIDRNVDNRRKKSDDSYQKVKYCITSATLLNLEAWQAAGGFDTSLFIDWVDNEICCALRDVGYETYQIGYVGLIQEMGHATPKKILGKKFSMLNYNYKRYYYNARNCIVVARRYPKEESVCRRLVNQIAKSILIIFYEQDKLKKVRAIFHGILDGCRISTKRLDYTNDK